MLKKKKKRILLLISLFSGSLWNRTAIRPGGLEVIARTEVKSHRPRPRLNSGSSLLLKRHHCTELHAATLVVKFQKWCFRVNNKDRGLNRTDSLAAGILCDECNLAYELSGPGATLLHGSLGQRVFTQAGLWFLGSTSLWVRSVWECPGVHKLRWYLVPTSMLGPRGCWYWDSTTDLRSHSPWSKCSSYRVGCFSKGGGRFPIQGCFT